METNPTPKERAASKQETCQICGKAAAAVYDPERPPPNRLCYRCAAEYGMQDGEEE
jgi:hypothetical protein